MRSHLTLARWLGPWAADGARPPVRRDPLRLEPERDGDRAFDAWLYRPARGRVRGAYLIAPGLHYAGPADPRMDRFCAVLAAAGIAVLAPFLPDYTALRIDARAERDLVRALAALLAHPARPPGVLPGVFSISFGSLLALRLAAGPAGPEIGRLVLFGPYLDWSDTIHFCLTGEIDGRVHGSRDPLNQAVVFMNLVGELPGAPADPAPLLAAWRRYVEATWGRPEMKVDGRHCQVARRIAAELPAELRPLYLVGCGAEPGALDLVRPALARASARTAFLDPRPLLPQIACPVTLVHGIDDDVIPYVQSQRLAAALPRQAQARVLLTGLYGHTGKSGVRGLPALARELVTMARILDAMVAGAGT
jgi:pimeloyl-ACP methyl ester carboxylesterase